MPILSNGKGQVPRPLRSDPESTPGTLLGDQLTDCYYCGKEVYKSQLKIRKIGKTKIFICEQCNETE